MAFTTDDFNKIWASTSPLTPYDFDEANYKKGWNFVGSTPPARQMWDYLQKLTDEKIQYIYNNMIPVGIVQAFAGTTTPQGWLLCDGSAVSRTTYAALFAVIGTTYGAGNGSTTFNLPNLTNRFIQGNSTSGSVKAAGLPNIKGEIGFRAFDADNLITINSLTPKAFAFTQGNGATFDWKIDRVTNSDNQKCDTLYFDANKSNSIYSDSVNTVQPPALTMRYIIKY